MRKQITFKINDPASFADITRDYFVTSGFKKISETRNELYFTRGNLLWNTVTFNPLTWKSRVKVVLKEDSVFADFDINTFGQLVTAKEEMLWNTFVDNYRIAIIEKVDLSRENATRLKETKRDAWRYVWFSLLGAVALGIPAGVIGYYTGFDNFASIGAIAGALVFLSWKIGDDRKKNPL